tara:strand:- start:471 stop:683 length:213 start_codon:yes stop_codon:yes gene_type:complete
MIELQALAEVLSIIDELSEKHQFWLVMKDGKYFFSFMELFPDQYDSLIFQGTIQQYLAKERKRSQGRRIK